jgi:proline iminopeptidase
MINLDKHRDDKYKKKYLSLIQVDKSYPIIKPYNNGYLDVGNNHKIYYEESGNKDGIPFLFLHGGPGGGLKKRYTKFFDASKIRIIGFDQRGCGRSLPFGSLENNTTWDLLKDIEKLRKHLKIDKWFVTGGSWGSTLTLVYAINHPDKVLGMLITGVCLLRQSEIDWLYKKGGASNISPEIWDEFENFIPDDERSDMVSAYYKRLCSKDKKIQIEACKRWSKWELTGVSLTDMNKNKKDLVNLKRIIPLSKIECHYFINKSFFPNDNYILDNVYKINHIPLYMIQGKYDIICPLESAYRLHKELPNSKLHIVTLAGHDPYEIPFINHIIDAINELIKVIKLDKKLESTDIILSGYSKYDKNIILE